MSRFLRMGLAGSQAVAASWPPGDVASATLVRAYESDYGVTEDVDGVASWEDRAGNADRVQATGAKKPALVSSVFDTLPAVQGDGTDDELAESGQRSVSGEFTDFWVVRFPSEDVFVDGDGALSYLKILTGGSIQIRIAGAGGAVTAGGATSTNTRHQITISRNSSDEINVRVNGSDVTSGTPVRAGDWDTELFCNLSGTPNYNTIQYGAALYYDGSISTDDRDSVESYLGRYLV